MEYLQQGKNPKLLILSGTHGDEYEVIESVKKSIKHYKKNLPSFMFIPEVSPSAVKLGTRENINMVDLNRSFFENTKEQEAKDVIKLLSKYKFETCLTFHEDVDENRFYMYDSENIEDTNTLKSLRKKIKDLGVQLYSGVDDPDDPVLSYEIVEGYKSVRPKDYPANSGLFDEWAFQAGIVNRIIYIEVPGKLTLLAKDKLVDAFFDWWVYNIG